MSQVLEAPLLTVNEISKLLACSPATVRNMVNRGDLPSVRFGTAGGVIRIHRDDLQSFIEAQRSSQTK